MGSVFGNSFEKQFLKVVLKNKIGRASCRERV